MEGEIPRLISFIKKKKHRALEKVMDLYLSSAYGVAKSILINVASEEDNEECVHIPGLGKAEENKGFGIYILLQPVKYSYEGLDITVNSVTKDNKGMEITMSWDGFAEIKDIAIVDAMGNKYVSSQSYTAAGNGWLGGYSFTGVPEEVNSFKILISETIEVPITLEKAESYVDYTNMGPTDIKNNYGITLVSTKVDDKIKFDLIQHQSENRQVRYYGKSDKEGHSHINISIKDDKGKSYALEHATSYAGTLSEFYFKPDSSDAKYIVEIPEITLMYKIDNEIALPMPKEGETTIDKSINMQGFNMKITQVSREGNRVRVYVGTNYDESKAENISVATLDMESLSLDMYRYQLDDSITTEYYEFNIDPNYKKLRLKFKEMYTILKGPWKFEVINK